MNPVIETILKRKSMRAYEKKAITPEERAELLRATLRAPTAGNLMLYSIIEVSDQHLKNKLVESCDNQPFIAHAPLVWLFLADYQRWFDYFVASGVEHLCEQQNTLIRRPQEGTCSWPAVMPLSPRRRPSSRPNRWASAPAIW